MFLNIFFSLKSVHFDNIKLVVRPLLLLGGLSWSTPFSTNGFKEHLQKYSIWTNHRFGKKKFPDNCFSTCSSLVKITNLYQWCRIWRGRRKSHHHKATKGNQIEKFHLFSVNVTVGLAFILKMGELEILPKYSNLELFSAFWYQKWDTSIRGNCSALQGSKSTCKSIFFVQNFITHWNVEI